MAEDSRASQLGPKLKAARTRKDVAQKGVASRLGVTISMISKWENGREFPAERRYVEYYANELGGGAELLAHYDRLAIINPSGSHKPEAVIERRAIERIFPAYEGDLYRVSDYRRIRALRDLESWEITESQEFVPDDDDQKVVFFGPGQLELVHKESLQGFMLPMQSIKHRLIFPETLKAGQTIEFTVFRSRKALFQEVTKKGEEGYRTVVPKQWPIESLRIGHRFPGPLPEHVWHYAMDSQLELSSGMKHLGQPLSLDQFGYAAYEWESLEVGLAYGIGWMW